MTTQSDTAPGLYSKYYVVRDDGRDLPGGDRESARYFVLDYRNDPMAQIALAAYAEAAFQKGKTKLATDLWLELADAREEESRSKVEQDRWLKSVD